MKRRIRVFTKSRAMRGLLWVKETVMSPSLLFSCTVVFFCSEKMVPSSSASLFFVTFMSRSFMTFVRMLLEVIILMEEFNLCCASSRGTEPVPVPAKPLSKSFRTFFSI